MKRHYLLALSLVIFLSLGGCATFQEVNKNWENLDKIKIGMPKGEVVTVMGSPYRNEVFILADGQTLEVLKYLINYDIGGPILTADTMPICIQDDKVIGWGQKFYRDKKRKSDFLYP